LLLKCFQPVVSPLHGSTHGKGFQSKLCAHFKERAGRTGQLSRHPESCSGDTHGGKTKYLFCFDPSFTAVIGTTDLKTVQTRPVRHEFMDGQGLSHDESQCGTSEKDNVGCGKGRYCHD